MKIDIVYTTKSKYIKCVADEMARWVKTYAQDLKHLLELIQSLSRQNVKNLALINCFFINSKRLMKVIHLCQNQQLPLMREQYTFKMSFDQRKEINPLIIDNARLYIEDMVNVIRDYY